MLSCRTFFLVCLVSIAVGGPAAAESLPGAPGGDGDERPAVHRDCGLGGQVGRGFALKTGVRGRLATLAITSPGATITTGTTMPDPSAQAGTGPDFRWNLFAGYKICRVLFGLNLDLSVDSPLGTSTVTTSFVLAPEVEVAIARSADRRAELLGVLNVGMGRTRGNTHFAALLAPGVRYWVHPHIALQTELGIAADVIFFSSGQSLSVNLLGTLAALGAF